MFQKVKKSWPFSAVLVMCLRIWVSWSDLVTMSLHILNEAGHCIPIILIHACFLQLSGIHSRENECADTMLVENTLYKPCTGPHVCVRGFLLFIWASMKTGVTAPLELTWVQSLRDTQQAFARLCFDLHPSCMLVWISLRPLSVFSFLFFPSPGVIFSPVSHRSTSSVVMD